MTAEKSRYKKNKTNEKFQKNTTRINETIKFLFILEFYSEEKVAWKLATDFFLAARIFSLYLLFCITSFLKKTPSTDLIIFLNAFQFFTSAYIFFFKRLFFGFFIFYKLKIILSHVGFCRNNVGENLRNMSRRIILFYIFHLKHFLMWEY